MTLSELIRSFRVRSNDKVLPYFWSDQELTDWFNESEREACLRGRLIVEAENPDICTIPVVADQAFYTQSPLLYELTYIAIKTDSCVRPIRLVSSEELDRVRPGWRSERPSRYTDYALQDDKKIRLVPTPCEDAQLLLEGFRFPMESMLLNDKDTVEPEIHRSHHDKLVEWVLHRAFSIPDTEFFDPQRSAMAEQVFANYFGIRPDSDLRRTVREDFPQTAKPYWS